MKNQFKSILFGEEVEEQFNLMDFRLWSLFKKDLDAGRERKEVPKLKNQQLFWGNCEGGEGKDEGIRNNGVLIEFQLSSGFCIVCKCSPRTSKAGKREQTVFVKELNRISTPETEVPLRARHVQLFHSENVSCSYWQTRCRNYTEIVLGNVFKMQKKKLNQQIFAKACLDP